MSDNISDKDDREIMSIVRSIKQKHCTPVLGNQLFLDMLFNKDEIISGWARNVGYPWNERDDLASIAQFAQFAKNEEFVNIKAEYLEFLYSKMVQRERDKRNANPGTYYLDLDQIVADYKNKSFTEMVCAFQPPELGYSDKNTKREQFEVGQDRKLEEYKEHQPPNEKVSQLEILAGINEFEVYITTSPHQFLEKALKNKDREAHTEVFPWNKNISLPESDFTPDKDHPLVYHLFGLETDDASHVMTEDDHIEFMINAHSNFVSPQQKTPISVRNAMTTKQLLLIGYQPDAWDLRALLKGLVGQLNSMSNRRPDWYSVAIQLDPKDFQNNKASGGRFPNPDIYRTYLKKSFELVQFKVIWRKPEMFMQELQKAL